MPSQLDHTVLALLDNFQSEILKVVISDRVSILRIDQLPDDQKQAFQGPMQLLIHQDIPLPNTSDKIPSRRQQFNTVRFTSASGINFDRTLE